MLATSDSSLTLPRYIRLMIMTFFLGSWNVALISLSTANEYLGGTGGLLPWTSWAAVHEGFGFIGQYHDSDFPSGTLLCIYLLWWAVPMSGLAFFAFFGIGEEAMKDYRANVAWVARVIFRRPSPASDAGDLDNAGALPSKMYRIPSIESAPPLKWEV